MKGSVLIEHPSYFKQLQWIKNIISCIYNLQLGHNGSQPFCCAAHVLEAVGPAIPSPRNFHERYFCVAEIFIKFHYDRIFNMMKIKCFAIIISNV